MNDLNAVIGFLKEATDDMARANYEASEQGARDRKTKARQIIASAYIDGMETLAGDGACCADLFATWQNYTRLEALAEVNTDAVFKSLDAAMRDCSDANLIALGRIVRDEAVAYIASCHRLDDADAQESINELAHGAA